MICPHCQQEHPDNASFCPNTGREMPRNLQSCPHCYREVALNVRFCPFCGGGLVSAQTKPIQAVPTPTPMPPVKARQTPIVLWLAILLGIILVGGGVYLVFINNSGRTNQAISATLYAEEQEVGVSGESESTRVSLDTTPTDINEEPQLTLTSLPIQAPTDTLQPTDTPESTPTPPSQPLALQVNTIDGAEIVLIPAGEFVMGSDPEVDSYFFGAEGPRHMVTLDEFWIYRTEVTNAMYQQCEAVQACPRPAYSSSNTRSDYYGNPTFADYPVIYVSWRHAAAYCVWAGGRLPTEAEWEKAGRGTDERLFPWGYELPNDLLARYDSNDTATVGSYPDGASPYGVFDMAGNVHEWVYDYFQASFYSVSPEENPLGPVSGKTRVYRGGAYHNLADAIRVVMRGSRGEDFTSPDIGFRCVIEIP